MNDDFLSCTYLVGDGSGDAFFVDAGGPVEPLIEAAERHGINVSHVLLTHHHHDHVSELPKIARGVPGRRGAHPPVARPTSSRASPARSRAARRRRRRARGRRRIHTPGPHEGDARLRRRRRRLHRRHAVQGLGRRRPRARAHDATRTSSTRSWTGSCALDHDLPDPPRPHRPDDDRRGVGEQPVHPPVARPRRGGRRARQVWGEHGDARPPRPRLRRRPQGVGPLAGRPRRHRARLAGRAQR